MKIKYVDFWRGFHKESELLGELFTGLSGSSTNTISIESVFPSPIKRLYSKLVRKLPRPVAKIMRSRNSFISSSRSIWYTGENIRPPFSSQYDLTLSFDQDDYSQKNIYLPLFYLRLLVQTEQSKQNLGLDFEAKELLLPRVSDISSRQEFACTFINNAEPTRLRAVAALSRIARVDVFGKVSGMTVKSKFDVAAKYKFQICFENDLFPGYVTEKLLDAYLCGCIPIYWGDLGMNNVINPKAFINYKDFTTLDELAAKIESLTPQELESMASEPLLLRLPTLEEIRLKIEAALRH